MDDDTGNPVESPPEEREPETAPPPTIEAFTRYRDRVQADKADGGRIGELMLSYANAQPEEVREKLETDVDEFVRVWDVFAGSLPPRPAPPPPQAPPERQEYTAPEWRRQQIEREARRKTPVLDATFSMGGGGVMPEAGTAERAAARSQQKEIDSIRQRVRSGEKEAEFELAQKLFGDAASWKTAHGPDHY